MAGFVKLFESILDSTVWLEDPETKVVWITMLAMADASGYVAAAVPGLAKRAGVSREAVDRALDKFRSPDPDSRSREHEGRRIVDADGGWMLLNYAKYRAKRDADTRREQNRMAQRRSRSGKSSKRRADEAFDAVASGLAPDYVYEEQEELQQEHT